MIGKQSLISILFITIFLVSCKQVSTSVAPMYFQKLIVDLKENPSIIESEIPVFSWVVNAEGFNKSQSTYHILVASSKEKLNESDADIWNSGEVKNDKSAFVKYQGKTLEALQRYFWKVKIWDEDSVASSWSDVQTFEMGLMNNSNWGDAKWITLNKDNRTSEYQFRNYKTGRMKTPLKVNGFAAGYFRNEIDVANSIKNAQAYICGLGYYELYLNGEKVGDHVLDPAPSNYDKQAHYVNYDITEQLKSGKNAFGIILGNGFYGQNISWKRDPESERDLAYGPPTVKLLIKVNYKDGTSADFYTDKNWKENTGPIVFNNI